MKLVTKTLVLAAIAASAVPFTARAIAINELEPNNSLATAQNVSAGFGLGANANIGSQFGIDPSVTMNVSILGTGNGTFDYYSFSLFATSRVTLDMDDHVNWIDSELGIWRSNGGGSFTLLSSVDDVSIIDPGSNDTWNAYLSINGLAAGDYVVGVGAFNTEFTHTGMTGNSTFGSYTLHITADSPSSVPSVPDAGSTLAMLSLAVVGMVAARRNLSLV